MKKRDFVYLAITGIIFFCVFFFIREELLIIILGEFFLFLLVLRYVIYKFEKRKKNDGDSDED